MHLNIVSNGFTMKTIALASLLAFAFVTSSCASHRPAEPAEPTPVTHLDEHQVNALIPFMVNREPMGELESHVFEAADRSFAVHYRRQAFTFELWIDADGYPVMPPKGDDKTSTRRATQHHGSFRVACQSACQWPVPNAEISCAVSGCQPISDITCGCTPADCGNCVVLGCGAFVDGFLAGGLVMR